MTGLAEMTPPLFAGIALAVLALLLLLFLLSMRRVPQGFEYTVERFGRFRRVLRPGLAFVMPLIDRIGARQDLRERSLALPTAAMLTRDRVALGVDATVFYQVVDAAKASYEVEDLQASLRALLTVSLRTLIGERSFEEVLAGRAELNRALLAAADDAAGVWGLSLTRTEVGELAPPEELVAAVRADLETQLRNRTELVAAEGERRSRQLRVDADGEAELAAARTRSEVARLGAEAIERTAEGDARATLMLSRALEQGSVHALNYLLARQYVDALKTLAASDNGRFVILPLENGGVAASLTGIRELAEATFPDDADLFEAPSPDADADAKQAARNVTAKAGLPEGHEGAADAADDRVASLSPRT